MSKHEAVQALEELGMTNYEAEVFIALQRLGAGTARDVAQVSDVPRPQVYSSAESLEELGLIDVQQSDPIRYRPVTIEEAKANLRNRFERVQGTAFEYIEDVHRAEPEDEQQENIWTISGRETISDRIAHLVGTAEREVLLGVESPSILGTDTTAALREAADDGVSVTVISREPSMSGRFEDDSGVAVVRPGLEDHEEATGRLLVVDEETVLLSAFGEESAEERSETAIWSSDTEFARVVIRLIHSYLQT